MTGLVVAILGSTVNAAVLMCIIYFLLGTFLDVEKKTRAFYSFVLYIILISVFTLTTGWVSPWPYIFGSMIVLAAFIFMQNKKQTKTDIPQEL